MEDLIKREDAIKALKDNVIEMGGDDFCEMGVHIDDIEAVVNAIPSADLNTEFAEWAKLWFKEKLEADRPQGEWKSVKASIYPYGYDVECSVCGHRMGSSFGYKYCPMCGAHMKGADDE